MGPREQAAQEADAADTRVERRGRASCTRNSAADADDARVERPDRASCKTAQLMLMMLGLSGPIEQVAQESARLMLMMLGLSGPVKKQRR